MPPCVVKAKMPDADEAEVRHRRVRDQALHVSLADREERRVKDSDRPTAPAPSARSTATPPGTTAGSTAGSRTCRPCRARRRAARHRRPVPPAPGVRQPGVERHQRCLDRERDEEAEEQPASAWRRVGTGRSAPRTRTCPVPEVTYTPITAASIRRPPTSEYRKNFIAAYWRRGPPYSCR
mgnify:CR=1 FL=1